MATSPSQGKFTLILLGAICLIALFLALRSRIYSTTPVSPSVSPSTPVTVASDWRADVTRILAEYDRNQDARAAEQALLALHVVDQDRETHLQLVLAFHALGESRPEGKAKLADARRLFLSSDVVR